MTLATVVLVAAAAGVMAVPQTTTTRLTHVITTIAVGVVTVTVVPRISLIVLKFIVEIYQPMWKKAN